MTNWCIALVATGHDLDFAADLERDGERAFCPSYEVRRRRANKRRPEIVRVPLYPGYVFVVANPAVYGKAREHKWFWTLLREAGEIAFVGDSIIDRIRLFEREMSEFRPLSPHPVREGDRAMIVMGPLSGKVLNVTSVIGIKVRGRIEGENSIESAAISAFFLRKIGV